MTLAEIMLAQSSKSKSSSQKVDVVFHMPEVLAMVRHLDMLYTKLIANKSAEQQSDNEGNPLVEILGKPYIQTRAWFNPGQGIKQSAVVE